MCLLTDARNEAGFVTLLKFIKKIGGWPEIDRNWVESKYDWINALIELNRNGIPELLSIKVEPDLRNTSRSLIEVNIN
jgi:hypothetical protein